VSAPASQPRPLKDYAVETLVEAGAHPGLVLGLATRGKEAIAVGGQGRDLVLYSKEGKTWSARSSGGHGLRGALYRENDELYVVGEYGYCAVSRDRGKTWHKLPRQPRPWRKGGEAPCLFAIVEDERGAVWTAGDSGYLGRVTPDGEQLEPFHLVDEYLGRIRGTPLGLLLPSDDGHLWRVKDEQATKLPVNAKTMLMAVALTPAETIIVVGQGGAIFRLPAGAKKATRIPAPEVLLTGVDVLADGQLLAVGEKGVILASVDDGASFTPVKHRSKKTLWCCRAYREGALIGGEQGMILGYLPR